MKSCTALALVAVLAVALAAGCAAPVNVETPLAAPSPETGAAGQSQTLATEIATYTLSGFESLPGWQQDDLLPTWPAFLSSCQVLDRPDSASWHRVCEHARQIDGKSNPALRAFFEHEFSVYQIHDHNGHSDGVVTGYSEPEIAGSRKYRPPYIYPVYGKPGDMLYLDVRKLPASGVVTAQAQGRQVVVQSGLSTHDLGRTDLYVLDLAQIPRNTTLDGKARLRAEGQRLLPYYTRQEIETRGLSSARVLAFVSSVADLYEIQIQGIGSIRLDKNDIIRLSYADQNGQAFRPMLANDAKAQDGTIELEAGDDDNGGFLRFLKPSRDNDTAAARTRGLKLALPVKSGPVAVPGKRIAGATGSGITDPSYVFFKEIPKKLGHTAGALGTPLWPGHSIAVDPRSMPLGYPVFVSTRLPSDVPMRRLLMAQDTGNAVRGALRADYFFGSGREAARQTRLMKQQHGQFWILLPRGQAVAAAAGTSKTSTRGGAAGDNLPQCLVPDGESCAEN